MKKKVATLLSTIVVASTIAVPTAYVSAAVSQDGSESTTEADVTFTSGEFKFTESALNNLKFSDVINLEGENGVTPTESTQSLKVSLLDENGTGGGWNVSAMLSAFEIVEGETSTPVLHSASITLKNGSANSTFAESDIFSGGNIENNNAEGIGEIELSQNDPTPIATAERSDVPAEAGMGPWDLDWAAENIELTVPAGDLLATDNTSATITWILSSGNLVD